ncbi:50S ribosomal protein L6 [Candidatus Pacearchaeota archaeon]|nr:50S ribosomal protein L6P [uncultured archaeon]MBS3088302.1 50S ribosomal protein L6 [Candidatus Pacearchaeota archaeon]
MKSHLSQSIEIPEGVTCTFENDFVKCKKGSIELTRHMHVPTIDVKMKDNKITLECKKGNKIEYKKIMTFQAHIKNLFKGLSEKFVYKLESANVHFPMSLKVEKEILIINNFLGEKVPRKAKILPNVQVKVAGNQITVESHDKAAAGQTAANFEQATKVTGRDRRIFQDGIYLTEKPGRTE